MVLEANVLYVFFSNSTGVHVTTELSDHRNESFITLQNVFHYEECL